MKDLHRPGIEPSYGITKILRFAQDDDVASSLNGGAANRTCVRPKSDPPSSVPRVGRVTAHTAPAWPPTWTIARRFPMSAATFSRIGLLVALASFAGACRTATPSSSQARHHLSVSSVESTGKSSRNVLGYAEFEEMRTFTAYDVVERYRPEFLQRRLQHWRGRQLAVLRPSISMVTARVERRFSRPFRRWRWMSSAI